MHILLAILLAAPAGHAATVVELHQHAALLYEHIQNDDKLSDSEKKEKRRELYESLAAVAEDESALTHELVGDPLVAGLVIEQFLEPDWDLDEGEAAGAAKLARSDGDEELRLDALRVLAVHHVASLDETAAAMAEFHDDFAHRAAAILCSAKTVESKVRAIEEECTLRSTSPAAVPDIAALARDLDEPEHVRFDAIYALAKIDTDEAHTELIRLLEPAYWFDGPGPVRYTSTHSLIEVISAIFDHARKSDRAVFENLRQMLPTVPDDYRDLVREHLETTLSALEALGM